MSFPENDEWLTSAPGQASATSTSSAPVGRRSPRKPEAEPRRNEENREGEPPVLPREDVLPRAEKRGEMGTALGGLVLHLHGDREGSVSLGRRDVFSGRRLSVSGSV